MRAGNGARAFYTAICVPRDAYDLGSEKMLDALERMKPWSPSSMTSVDDVLILDWI